MSDDFDDEMLPKKENDQLYGYGSLSSWTKLITQCHCEWSEAE